MIRVGLLGAQGRLGQSIATALQGALDCQLVLAAVRGSLEGHGECVQAFGACDVVLDASQPQATLTFLEAAVEARCPFIVCTTGGGPALDAKALEAAQKIPVLWAPNLSQGVAVLKRLCAQLGLDADWDMAIHERHHRHKKDAPSGTALLLASTWEDRDVPIQSQRGGTSPGEHTVFALGAGEEIALTHRLLSREALARGAVAALRWMARGRPPGLYGMAEVWK